jgi:hypothetical protein
MAQAANAKANPAIAKAGTNQPLSLIGPLGLSSLLTALARSTLDGHVFFSELGGCTAKLLLLLLLPCAC